MLKRKLNNIKEAKNINTVKKTDQSILQNNADLKLITVTQLEMISYLITSGIQMPFVNRPTFQHLKSGLVRLSTK